MSRIAVPFLPPAKDYIPLEKLVEIVPDLGYQLYFADRAADSEVYNAVCRLNPRHSRCYS